MAETIRHSPDALIRAMAHGLDGCHLDDSGVHLAFLLRAVSRSVGDGRTDESDMADALELESALRPHFTALDHTLLYKVVGDLETFGGLFTHLATAIAEFGH